MRHLAFLFGLLVALPALAQDAITWQGRLQDADFYRMATCGAVPGGECLIPMVRWGKPDVTVALLRPERGYPADKAAQIDQDLDHAIAAINDIGSGLHLTRADRLRRNADIVVTPTLLNEGDKTRRIPRMPDGQEIGVGFMWLWWDDRNLITEASILITSDITPHDLHSVMLEELFQCLGFLYDLENPYYQSRSILAQDSNETTRIAGQDRMALLRHYPPK